MRQGLTLVLVGTAAGLAGAAGAARLIRGQLYGGAAFDPVTFIAVPIVLLVVAGGAIWVPARRAAGLDPLAALRQE
jgi:ABC-type antimicrobial peptide transport system permease subunit